VIEGYVALVHTGGAANDLLPAYLTVALAAGLAMGGHPGGLLSGWADRLARVWSASCRPGRIGPWVAAASAALVIAQLAVLMTGFWPRQAIPTLADRAVGARLTAGLRTLGGTIAMPTDPGVALLAGLPTVAHEGAAYDVLRSAKPAVIARFTGSAARAVAAERFTAIVTEDAGPPDGFPADLWPYYRLCPQTLFPGIPADVFQFVAYRLGRPEYVWLPAGRSCAAAVRAFSGQPGSPGRAASPGRPGGSGGRA